MKEKLLNRIKELETQSTGFEMEAVAYKKQVTDLDYQNETLKREKLENSDKLNTKIHM